MSCTEAVGGYNRHFSKKPAAQPRNTFISRYYFMDPFKDIAASYDMSESKTKSMLHHTRIKLKEYLERDGFCL